MLPVPISTVTLGLSFVIKTNAGVSDGARAHAWQTLFICCFYSESSRGFKV